MSCGNTNRRAPRAWAVRTAYLYLLPALALYALFVIVPVAHAFYLSLFHWQTAVSTPVYVGLANFKALLHDGVFWSALWHNALLLVLSLVVQLPVAMLLAVLVNRRIRGRWLFRTVFFSPMVMPSVAIAVLWSFIYLPEHGLLDQVIRLFDRHFGGNWLGGPNTAMLCVFVTICWRYIGFHMVLFMAGLATIPEELYDAAQIDGASEWQSFRRITLPMLYPMIGVSATLSIIGSLKYFDLVYMMAGGAPAESRELMATYVYRLAFDSGQGRFGYGSAVAVVLFVIAFIVALGVIRFGRQKGSVTAA